MSNMPGMDRTLHEVLTQLLMDNGAAVTKTSIDELILFIANRDGQMAERVVGEVQRIHRLLTDQTRPYAEQEGSQHD